MSLPTALLLSRPGCHLCDQFEADLEAAFANRLRVDVLHIDHYPEYLPRYGWSIPVLLAEDGTLLSETFLDASRLHDWLAAH